MAVAAGRMSAAEYLATPESRPRHTELIDGTVVVSEPKLPHSRIQAELIYRFRLWIDGGANRGYVSPPADLMVNEDNVLAPDVWWVGEARRPHPAQLDLFGLPDLVIEIRSPSTWIRDLGIKLRLYEAGGVPEAWFVDSQALTVLVFRRSRRESPGFDVMFEVTTDGELTSPLLEGFVLPLRTIFGC